MTENPGDKEGSIPCLVPSEFVDSINEAGGSDDRQARFAAAIAQSGGDVVILIRVLIDPEPVPPDAIAFLGKYRQFSEVLFRAAGRVADGPWKLTLSLEDADGTALVCEDIGDTITVTVYRVPARK